MNHVSYDSGFTAMDFGCHEQFKYFMLMYGILFLFLFLSNYTLIWYIPLLSNTYCDFVVVMAAELVRDAESENKEKPERLR